MKRVGLVVMMLGGAQLAHADGPWGAAEDAAVCEQEYAAHIKDWMHDPSAAELAAAMKSGGVSEPCKKEIEKRAAQCASDPDKQKVIKDEEHYHIKDGAAYCKYMAFWFIGNQVEPLMIKKQNEARAAKEAAEKAAAAKAALDATELPEVGLKNAALEKAVATAYNKDYPDTGKILKVFLDRWVDDDLEKDSLGRVIGRDLSATVLLKQSDGKCMLHYELWLQHGNGRSYSGPLAARGGGSAKDHEILCSKTAGAGGGKAKKN